MYKGEWKNDKMHGCGIKRSLQESGELEVEAGHFKHDKFVGLSSDCDMAAAEEASQKAQKAACLSCGLLVSHLIHLPALVCRLQSTAEDHTTLQSTVQH